MISPAPRILVASGNRGKVNEFRKMLASLPVQLLDLEDFPDIGTVDEVGDTFGENARLKAVGYSLQAGISTLADDSGLEVDALYGAPGVRSARYAGEAAPESMRIQKLLQNLASVSRERRSARFVCALVLTNGLGDVLTTATGICEGAIAESPRGVGGFGYDPLFVPKGYSETFGELSNEDKNQLSHRAQALNIMIEFISRNLSLLS